MEDRGAVHVFADPAALAAALADTFVESGERAIAQREVYRVALAGGDTPRKAYELLAQQPRRSRLPWDRVYVYFGDERCVPPTDDRSNYRMADEAFLSKVPIPRANVHRMAGEIEPGHAANEYASVIRDELKDPPHFDLVMLGLGPDGHTASLFPGALPPDDDSLVRAEYSQAHQMWRISITPKLINLARAVVFGVEGSGKADILAAVLESAPDPERYPAQIVHPLSGTLLWYVDRAAAAKLHGDVKQPSA